jgi:hypothetical protein
MRDCTRRANLFQAHKPPQIAVFEEQLVVSMRVIDERSVPIPDDMAVLAGEHSDSGGS